MECPVTHTRKIRLVRSLAFAGVALSGMLCTTLSADLLARWTFNNENTYLTSNGGSLGPITLTRGGAGGGQTDSWNSGGTVSLGTGRLLYTNAINSTAIPEIQKNVTIWARMRFDGAIGTDVTYAGFLDAAGPADWGQFSLVLKNATTNKQVSYGRFNDDSTQSALSTSAASSVTPIVGQFFDVAVVLSTNETLGRSSMTYYIRPSGSNNYLVLTSTINLADGLQEIDIFGIGRLKSSGGSAMTFDELHIYNSALTADQIYAIPEPSVTAAVIGAAALVPFALLLRRRRRMAK